MHQPTRSSDENVAGVTASADEAVEGRKFIRKITSLIIVAGAVLITLYVWGIIERHPRTDDATARANVVGIAPRVAGQNPHLLLQGHRAFFRTCHQSQHFARSPCYHRGSRLLVARHEQMVCDREFSRGGNPTYGSRQRSDCLSLVRA